MSHTSLNARNLLRLSLILAVCMSYGCMTTLFAAENAAEALSEEATEYLSDDKLPPRTQPIIELGPKFLSTGNISSGYTLPTGAVWTPSVWVYGNLRSAYQVYEDQDDLQTKEWVNRLDLFVNLQLSGTERLLVGLTPLHDRDTGRFSGRRFAPDGRDESLDEINAEIDTLFFEGDLAEIFPKWDYLDSQKNDIGISIGRQSISFSGGQIVSDNMDGFGISKNNIRFAGNPNIINWRSSFFLGMNGVHRSDNVLDKDSTFYGWFNQIDTIRSTYNFDVAYVDSDRSDELLNLAIDTTRRIGKTNLTLRTAYSKALDQVTAQSDTGVLLFTELSWIPKRTHDNVYLNGFIAIDQFTAAARGPLAGGPLGQTGLLFAAQGVGQFPAPLSNQARDAKGIALGYQRFSKDRRTQWVLEAAARFEDENTNQVLENEYGLALRFQRALGHRTFVQFDVFAAKPDSQEISAGSRLELQVKL